MSENRYLNYLLYNENKDKYRNVIDRDFMRKYKKIDDLCHPIYHVINGYSTEELLILQIKSIINNQNLKESFKLIHKRLIMNDFIHKDLNYIEVKHEFLDINPMFRPRDVEFYNDIFSPAMQVDQI